MDVEFLSRVQFAFTIAFHYVFPPLSIGLALVMVILEGTYLKTGNEIYHQATRFWVKVFGLIFSIGVASGIVMEFQFGTNWAAYSRFVGDVFGSALAAEGIFAFFLESGFLAVLLFGWDRVSKRMHFLSTVLVAFGATMSAFWIIVANSWQQTPAGHHLVERNGVWRAEITSFWELLFNPSTLDRFSHVIVGAWLAGAFLVLSVSAYYALKRVHPDFVRVSVRAALPVAVIASILQLVTGHSSAVGVASHQPAKLAAYEGHFAASAPAGMYLFGWVDDEREQVTGVQIPGLLSLMVHGEMDRPVTGLRAFEPRDRPPVNPVFQSYHAMVAIGMALIGVGLLGAFFWWRGTLLDTRWFLWVLVFSVVAPQAANQLGWFSAEVGRQPWIVYGLLRTSDGLSKSVEAGQVIASLVMFGLVYLLLFALFIFLLDRKIRHGPVEDEGESEELEGRHRA